jgi:hypothetical protein
MRRLAITLAAAALAGCAGGVEDGGVGKDGSRSVTALPYGGIGSGIDSVEALQRLGERMAEQRMREVCGANRVVEQRRTWPYINMLVVNYRCEP